MDRQRWAFALVGVAAARVGGETRIALAGAAPIPWLLVAGRARRRDAASRNGVQGRDRAHARGAGDGGALDTHPASSCGASSFPSCSSSCSRSRRAAATTSRSRPTPRRPSKSPAADGELRDGRGARAEGRRRPDGADGLARGRHDVHARRRDELRRLHDHARPGAGAARRRLRSSRSPRTASSTARRSTGSSPAS